MTQPLEAWDSLVRALADEVPEATFDAWVKPITADEKHGRLRLCCPSTFHRDRVRERLLPRIEAGLRALGAESLQVALDVDATAAPRTPRKGPRSATPATDARTEAKKSPGPALLRVPPRSAEPESNNPTGGLPAFLNTSFDTFVPGLSNALPRAAGLALAQGRQAAMSPLFIVGGPGLGKSHLADAIAREARRAGKTRAMVISAEQFTNELTQAIRAKRTADFKARYRDDVDVLLVDDVDFVQGKRATQDELFHTLDALTRRGRRIVLTATRMPRDIPNLDPRLASRMSGGLCAEIEAPDRDHRRKILRTKAAAGGFRIPGECLELLAEAPFESVRDLESTLIQLVASAALLNRPLDLALARAALERAGLSTARERSPQDIAREVAAFFGSSLETLASPSRRRDVMWPRQVAMYLCHRFTPASTKEIGRLFARGHSPVRNAIQVVERAILERAPRRYQVEAVMARLNPEASASGPGAAPVPVPGDTVRDKR